MKTEEQLDAVLDLMAEQIKTVDEQTRELSKEKARLDWLETQGMIDDLFHVNAVKLDIEGSKIEILEICDFGSVRKLVFEYHFDRCRSIPRFLAICERLRGLNFVVNHPKMPDSDTFDFYPAAVIVRCVKSTNAGIRGDGGSGGGRGTAED